MTLDETIKFAESNNRRIPLFSLTDIITGAVIELEKSGFVKIIREEDEEWKKRKCKYYLVNT